MKNVTISVDDDTYRAARIHAAERGTSISALVKAYLNGLAADAGVFEQASGVREMQATFASPGPVSGPPWTPGGKPRQPGTLRGVANAPSGDADDAWPADVLAGFDAWDEGDFDAVP